MAPSKRGGIEMRRCDIPKYKEALELHHYGILGMKWGRRKGKSKDTLRRKVASASEEAKKTSKIRKKKIYEMTNDELSYVTRRMSLEQNYKTLKKAKKSTGRRMMEKTLEEQGKKVLVAGMTVAGKALYTAYKAYKSK